MKRGFTLLELLVVIGIMGLLGTVSIGGYRAITRGMEERGAIDNASRFVHAAFQRALIDRQPVAVYFWNETIKGETADDNEIVVGKAVAVRTSGRLSCVDGDMLYDEFADLNLTYPVGEEGENAGSGMYLYPMLNDGGFDRSRIASVVYRDEKPETFLLDPRNGESEAMPNNMVAPPADTKGKIPMYGFELTGGYRGWRAGDAYGFEFQYLTLPHNYIFGDQYNKTMDNPVSTASQQKLFFGGGIGGYENRKTNLNGSGTVDVYALRPDASGSLKPVKVGETADPAREGV